MITPSKQTISAWVSLVRAYNLAFPAVESALKKAGYPPLNWYDVLLELDRAKPDGLRPFELQEKILLPQYGMSRLISRIEKKGYLERMHCEDDGRGQHLRITPSGIKLREQMWRVYGAILEEVIGEKLTDTQAEKLTVLLKNIA